MAKSYAAGHFPAAQHKPLYGEYSLPRSVLNVVVSDADSGSGSGGGAASGTTPTSISNTVTVTNQAAGAEAAAAAKPANDDTAKLPKSKPDWCTALRASYAADVLTTLQYVQTKNGFDAKLNAWITNGLAKSDQAAALKDIESFAAAFKTYIETADRGRSNASLIDTQCPLKLKVQIQEATEADHMSTFRLYGSVNAFSNDHVTTEFDGGMIKTVSITADSQAAEVIEAIAKTVAMFFVPGPPVGAVGRVGAASATDLDVTIAKMRKQGITHNLLVELQDEYPAIAEPLPAIDISLPVSKTFELSDLESKKVTIRADIKVQLSGDCSAVPNSATTNAMYADEGGVSGVVTSMERVCTIVAIDPNHADVPLARSTFPVLDSRYAYNLPIDRTTFIKRATSYSFANGRLTKADVDYPSTGLAVVSLPLQVVNAVVGSITDAFKSKQGEIEAQTKRIEAETANYKAAADLKAAKDAANQPTSSTTAPTVNQ
ncbi:hypothetical protein [Sphingomonas sp. PR090111-T3T-6A]|uniref:hypothetical protein n=1 Tax=Sphingomonas sp. PR090111-T3T-6A TaxID=685778 RepID=UPI0012FC124A|nr:hypothetical protein [Sphingomonas sp. PR090111-T3T-6A]